MSKPNTRDQIFDAALKLLLERGFNASSVQDITVEAGVPKGSFYNHFESKEALAAEIVSDYASRRSTLREILADDRLPALERLRGYFTALNQRLVDRGFQHGCMIGNMTAELSEQSPVIREQLLRIYGNWSTALEYAITAGQQDGSIPNQLSAKTLAGFLLNAWEGATLRVRVERSPDAFDQFMEVVFNKVLS
ncbi:TetR/AcrR family transcriptional regulator [Herbaspirillum lusitanum]|uniref:TetR/AcrR family transcriptional regulator n=1 Tax=Herbaspirillum lusitanum TaxID=213312 RepID=UPI000309D4AA|nr:TetR/AcrR family transcriptional regulator [Herbaspirillum lusitanum]MCW5297154.1 TetR family transcriptional regulator [Herbaspirillum lusitanum]